MRYSVRVTDGHCYRDLEIETDMGVEEACSLAMDRATEIERSGDVCYWEAFECSMCDGETRLSKTSVIAGALPSGTGS